MANRIGASGGWVALASTSTYDGHKIGYVAEVDSLGLAEASIQYCFGSANSATVDWDTYDTLYMNITKDADTNRRVHLDGYIVKGGVASGTIRLGAYIGNTTKLIPLIDLSDNTQAIRYEESMCWGAVNEAIEFRVVCSTTITAGHLFLTGHYAR
jgi:hypothetical protein